MRTIFKYHLPLGGVTNIPLPADAQVLHIGATGDDVCMWVLLDPDSGSIARYFRIFGTGEHVGDVLAYLGTAQTYGGRFVWHVFEIGERPA